MGILITRRHDKCLNYSKVGVILMAIYSEFSWTDFWAAAGSLSIAISVLLGFLHLMFFFKGAPILFLINILQHLDVSCFYVRNQDRYIFSTWMSSSR